MKTAPLHRSLAPPSTKADYATAVQGYDYQEQDIPGNDNSGKLFESNNTLI